ASGARTLSHADIIGTASASDRERLEPEDIGVAGLDVGTDRALVRPERPVIRDAQPPVLIGVTGRDRDEVRSTAQDLVDASADRTPALSELAAAGRILPGAVRATVVTSDAEAAVSALRALARGAADSPDIAFGPGSARAGPPLLLFSGQGGQHARMGRALAARYPAFARALAEVTDAVAGAGGPRVWTPRNGFGGTTTVDTVQTSLFVYQVAMAELLAAWGIRPGAVTGHGPGEIAAAVVAGAISLTDGAALISTRARVQAAGDADAAAVMFEATAQQVRRLIEPLRTQVAVTAVNGPRAVVVSGPARYVATLMRRARRRQFRIHPVPMELAHHGPASRARAERLLAEQPAVTPRPPRIPIFATSRAGLVVEPGRGGMRWDSDYWLDNLCGTVELDDAIASAIARGFSTVVEISPRPILAAAVHARSGPIVVPAADRDDEARTFLRALGTLYVRGNDLNWSIQGPATRPLTRRNWRRAATPAAPGAVGADRPEDHIVSEADTVPASYWLLRLMDSVPAPARLRTIDLAGPIGPENLTAVEYRLGDRPRITLGTRTVASARTASPATPADILTWMRRVEAYRAQTAPAAAEVDDFYRELLARGLDHGPDFRRLTRIRTGNGCAVGEFDAAPMTSATLEGCLQLITAAADPADIAPGRSLRMDSAWIADLRRIRITEAYAFVTGRSHTDVVADVIALDQYDAPAVALLGVRMPVTSRDRCSTVSSGTAQ
ncbi:MAG: acyltransferase domain-containing protein, partial [Nocardia sp.]|nr:acyltransferase domain-containing protein [Nocardia sp.]